MVMIFSSCSTGNTEPTSSPTASPTPQVANEVQAQIGPVFTNAAYEGGLYLGMESAKVSEIFGKPNEDGWTTLYDTVFITSIEGRAALLMFGGDFSWKTSEGFTKGTPKSEIRKSYGEPDEERKAISKYIEAMDTYIIEYNEDTSYILQFTYDGILR